MAQPQVIRNITQANERLEMTVNSSRILTLEKRIPRMVVNNPELVSVTALSANQVQLAALKPGVTQVNLWDEDDKIYTVDVIIYGDVRELELALDRIFPGASVKVIRLTNSLVLEGFVERPEDVGPIIRLAEDYAPKLINNITVGGVQQVMLKVKVMEVSRTKLRRLGIDWAQSSNTDYVTSGVSDLISSVSATDSVLAFTSPGGTFEVFVGDGSDAFLAVIDALQQNNLAKILADPTITTVSGRPAKFLVGGELPIL
ncbi:MAG: pilus assembly protein N-terminal domain-containing protein, partial [Planctomycetes bacterium]|nr:pilus assembly protein N-terminal domain-containing protein [Planctomycetota bacterium]